MTSHPSGPLQPVVLDGPAQRRRRLATGAGIVAVAGIVVAGMALADRPARQPVGPQPALGVPPSSAASPASATAVSEAPSVGPSVRPSAVAPSASAPAQTSARADVDGDGRPDAVSVSFLGQRSAQVAVHLASGKSLTSKAFPLYHGDGAGVLTPVDVNGDGQVELMVTDPGADGTGYELFSYANGALVEVAAPKGLEQPFLYSGGGMYYQSAFGCTGHHLVVAREEPVVASTDSLPPDPRFRVTTTTYALADGALAVVSSRSETAPDRAAASALLARTAGDCGARP